MTTLPPDSPTPITDPPPRLGLRDLLFIYLKVGFTFGGGLALLAAVQDELVTRRRVVSEESFLNTYSFARIVPVGTTTALAVAYGYRFGGVLGTIVTLSALAMPAFTLTLLLTAAYTYLQGTDFIGWSLVTILPAALAFIVSATIKLSRSVFKSWAEGLLAVVIFGISTLWDVNPAILLILGGVVGIFIGSRARKETP